MPSRRAVIRAAAGTAGSAVVVGCTAAFGDEERADGCPTLEAEPDYEEWFDGIGTFRGTCDRRNASTVTIHVGAHGGLGYNRFVPTAVAVAPGTTLRWEWTGKGGPHDVVAESEAFDSGDPVDDAEAVFERALETPGLYRYYCTPHRRMGMRGAVYVAPD